MSMLRTLRIAAWGAVLVAISLSAGLAVFRPWETSPARPLPPDSSSGIAAIGGPFRLTSHQGRVVDNASLAGRPYLVFFGFTNCPDICPTTLSELTDLMTEMGPAADKFTVLFITVDPERDTKELLAEYMTAFDPRILALRGTSVETAVALKAFAAYASKVPMEGGFYTMNHTAGVFLLDAKSGFIGTLDMHEPRSSRLAKLRRLAGG